MGSPTTKDAPAYVIDAVREDPGIGFLRTDKDLNRGIARADLDWLFEDAAKADDPAREKRLRAIATLAFPDRDVRPARASRIDLCS